MIEQRPHQQKGVADLGDALRAGYRAPILIAPTAFGKTICAGFMIERFVSRGKRCMFVTHRTEILQQTSAKLRDFGIRHGLIKAGYLMDARHAVHVASKDTLLHRLDNLTPPDVLFFDECHLAIAQGFVIVRKWARNAILIGLTATPCRLDGRGLGIHCGGMFDVLVPTVSPAYLIEQGFIPPMRYIAPTTVDMSQVKTVAGEWDRHGAEAVMDKPSVIGDVIASYREHCHQMPGMIFTPSIKSAHDYADAFTAAGYRAMALSGKTPDKQRADALRDQANGQLDVILNCSLFIEGLDQTCLRYIGLASPSQALTRYLQEIGRGARLHASKDWFLVADHANMITTHGNPIAPREWSLDGRNGKRKDLDEELEVRQCPKCYAWNLANLKVCGCGHVFATVVRERVVQQVEGDMHEIDVMSPEAIAAAEARRAQGMARTIEGLARTFMDRGSAPDVATRRAAHVIAGREEKAALRRDLAQLRIAAGLRLTGIDELKPKQLRAEIAALREEGEVA